MNLQVSIVYDLDCQNGFNRYHIYRSDGNVYNLWEEFPKEGG